MGRLASLFLGLVCAGLTYGQSSTIRGPGGVQLSNGVVIVTPAMFLLTTAQADTCVTWTNETEVRMEVCTANSTQLWAQRLAGQWESIYRPNRCLSASKNAGGDVTLADCADVSSQKFLPLLLVTAADNNRRCVGPCQEVRPVNSSVCVGTPAENGWCIQRAHTAENSLMWPVRLMDLTLGQGIWVQIDNSSCSADTCGWGYTNLTYTCQNINGQPPFGFVNSFCDFNIKPADRYGGCVDVLCNPQDGEWGDWTNCSETCGKGIRQRGCFGQAYGGQPCPGNDTEICEVTPCPVNGNYTEWSSCTTTCGPGVQTRTCTNPAPAYGGKNCTEQGLGAASRPCDNKEKCPDRDGGFTEWTTCSATCGYGTQLRSCTNPTPSGNGKNCTGDVIRVCDTGSKCPEPTTSSSEQPTSSEVSTEASVPTDLPTDLPTESPTETGIPTEQSTDFVTEQPTDQTVNTGFATDTAAPFTTEPASINTDFVFPSDTATGGATGTDFTFDTGFPTIGGASTSDPFAFPSNSFANDPFGTATDSAVFPPQLTDASNPNVFATNTPFPSVTFRARREGEMIPRAGEFPNGTIVGQDGTVTFTNGIKRLPNNTILIPGGPNETYTIFGGLVTFPAGTAQMIEGGRVVVTVPSWARDSQGVAVYQRLPITFPPSTILVPNGAVLYQNGTTYIPTTPTPTPAVTPTSSSTFPPLLPSSTGSGSVVPPTALPSGVLSTRPMPTPSQGPTPRPITTAWTFPDGAIFFPNGTLQLPSGDRVLPNGTIVNKTAPIVQSQEAVNDTSSAGLQPWAIAIIAVVGVLVFALIVGTALAAYRHHKSKQTEEILLASAFSNPTETPQLRSKHSKGKSEMEMLPKKSITAEGVNVTFQLECIHVGPEEYVVVVGNTIALGNWSISEAPCMLSLGNGRYKLTARLPANTQILYRFAKVRPSDYRAVYMGRERMMVSVGESDVELSSAIW